MIYLLSLIGFFGIFSTTMSKNPVLPLFVHDLGGNNEILGLIAAISPLAGIVFSFPVGILIDHIGQKKLLVAAAVVFVLAPLLYVLVSNPWFLIPIRFFHGLATAILGPLSATMIFHAYPENKGERLGFYSSATLFGRTLAPLFGGMILTLFAGLSGLWSYRLVYMIAGLVALPVLIFSLFIKFEKNQSDTTKINDKPKITFRLFVEAFSRLLKHARLLSTALVEMAIYFTFGILETYLPIYLHDNGYSASKIGLIFSLQILAIAFTKPFFGKLADRIDKRAQVVLGICILVLSVGLLPLTVNYYIIVALSVLFGVGMSFSTVATNSYVGDIAPKENLGASMGALSAIMDIGHSSGPFVAGIIVTYFAFAWGFWFAPIVCLVTVLIFGLFNRQKALSSEVTNH